MTTNSRGSTEYNVGKIDAAVDQIDWAIRLFLDHEAYVPAITLAGAAEEIIGAQLGDEASFRILRDKVVEEFGLEPKEASQQFLNRAKNYLKHWTQGEDEKATVLELETEAIQYIIRAISNLSKYDDTMTSETLRMLKWLWENKKSWFEQDGL